METFLAAAEHGASRMSSTYRWRIPARLLLTAGLLVLMLLSVRTVDAFPQSQAQQTPAPGHGEHHLVIETDSELPDTYPQADYQFRFHVRGGALALHWHVEKGALPPGMILDPDGLLRGQAERPGEFQFTVAVSDSSQPPQAVQKGFSLRVRSALTLKWKTPAHVTGNRIEGSAEVSNTTPDDIDLTFIVMAMPDDGRATAIGYQHFLLQRGMIGKELPFGETLPRGGYIVHLDAVGEV